MADAFIKSIAVGKKDAVFNRWRLAVINNDKVNSERNVSFFIKKALLAYCKQNTFIELGKIHFDPKIDKVSKKASVNLWLNDMPDLMDWVKQLESNGFIATKVFKEIVIRCIKIIPMEEEEYIPTYYDFVFQSADDEKENIFDTKKIPGPEVLPIPEVLPQIENTPKPTASIHETVVEKKKPPTKKSNVENDPLKYFGLGNKK